MNKKLQKIWALLMTVCFSVILSGNIVFAEEPATSGGAAAITRDAEGEAAQDRQPPEGVAEPDKPAEGGAGADAASDADAAGTDGTTQGTVLPGTEKKMDECMEIMKYVNWGGDGDSISAAKIREAFKKRESPIEIYKTVDLDDVSINDVLGCGIKTGDIKLWMVPYYIRFILEFIISLAGLISVASLVYGGYVYLFAGVSDDKEKGKKAIMFSIAGFVVTTLAWAIVTIVISLLT